MKKVSIFAAIAIAASAFGALPAFAANTYTVIEGCHYPNGWNVGDFERDLQGVPNGRQHECLDTYHGMQRVERHQIYDY